MFITPYGLLGRLCSAWVSDLCTHKHIFWSDYAGMFSDSLLHYTIMIRSTYATRNALVQLSLNKKCFCCPVNVGFLKPISRPDCAVIRLLRHFLVPLGRCFPLRLVATSRKLLSHCHEDILQKRNNKVYLLIRWWLLVWPICEQQFFCVLGLNLKFLKLGS